MIDAEGDNNPLILCEVSDRFAIFVDQWLAGLVNYRPQSRSWRFSNDTCNAQLFLWIVIFGKYNGASTETRVAVRVNVDTGGISMLDGANYASLNEWERIV